MGIVDTVAAIPTNANLTLRLRDAETQISELKQKNSILEQEKVELQTRLEKAEQGRRALEEQIKQKLIEVHSAALQQERVDILLRLAKPPADADEISVFVNREGVSVVFDIEELESSGLVSSESMGFAGVMYALTKEGRRRLKSLSLI